LVWPADLVVMAAGLLPDNGLHASCVAAGAAAEAHTIGDSSGPGRVFEAVKAGYAVANAL
jgi:predicted NAD/FAD-dependent oxidoreductase